MASVAVTEQKEDSQTASIAVTGKDKDLQMATIAVSGQDEYSQMASIAVTGRVFADGLHSVTGQNESLYVVTTDTSKGSAVDAATSGGPTVVQSGCRESSATVPSTVTREGESALLGATTTQVADASTATLGGFAACAATSGETVADTITSGEHSSERHYLRRFCSISRHL